MLTYCIFVVFEVVCFDLGVFFCLRIEILGIFGRLVLMDKFNFWQKIGFKEWVV